MVHASRYYLAGIRIDIAGYRCSKKRILFANKSGTCYELLHIFRNLALLFSGYVEMMLVKRLRRLSKLGYRIRGYILKNRLPMNHGKMARLRVMSRSCLT